MRFGFVSLLVGVACLFGLAGSVNAQGAGFSAADCVRPIVETGGLDPASAQLCAGVANTRRVGIEAARARFYAGRAYAIGHNEVEAQRNLEIAVNAAPDYGPAFTRELRAARYELVESYLRKGGGGIAQADELLHRYAPEDVAYERARVAEVRSGDNGRDEAFTALSGVFTRSDSDLIEDPACLVRNPPRTCGGGLKFSEAEARRGRTKLFELGMALGNDQLVQHHPDVAANYFSAAKDVIVYACPLPSDPPRVNSCPTDDSAKKKAFFSFGVARLLQAGVPQSANLDLGQAGGLDCLNGERTERDQNIEQARRAFQQMSDRWPNDTDAKWGKGCAILANIGSSQGVNDQSTNLSEAIRLLTEARPNTGATWLSLARAQAMRGDAAAQGSFQNALALVPPNNGQARSAIYVEMARTRYFRPDNNAIITHTGTTLYTRTVTEVDAANLGLLASAQGNLQQALSADQDNVEAGLILGHIYLRQEQYAQAGQAFSRVLERSRRDTTGLDGASFLMSKCMTQSQMQFFEQRSNGRACGGHWSSAQLAVQAFNINPTSVPYRHQACVANILFAARGDEYCAADSGRDAENYAEALLYDGLYWLSRARGSHDRAALSRAMQAFQAGLADTRSLDTPVAYVAMDNQPPLRDLLEYGQRYVLYSLGLSDRKLAGDDVKHFYKRFGFVV